MIIRSWVWADKWRLTLSSQTPLSADLSLEFPLDVHFLPLTFSHLRFHQIFIISWRFKAHMPFRFLFYFKLFYLRQKIKKNKFSVYFDFSEIGWLRCFFHVHNDFPPNLCKKIFFYIKCFPLTVFDLWFPNICIVCRWFNAHIPLR